MYRAVAKNKWNTILILVLFLGIVGGLGYLAAVIYRNPTIVIIAVGASAAYALIQYFTADRQAIAASGALPVTSAADHPRLWRTVENLAITTGTPMPKVYIINDPAPNAFATGRDPKHASVAATTGLLDIMDDAELEGVMAHELGHVRNYDIRVSMIVFGLVVAVGFISDFVTNLAFFGGNRRDEEEKDNNPVLFIVGIIAMLLAPLIATIVQLAISRQREYLADATGALTTRHPEALARALAKLETYGQPMQKQNSSMSHLWIADPLKQGIMSRLFATHPPIPERIARLNKIGSSF